MSQVWKKLFIRKNCDLPTFCGVELTAYTEIWRLTKKRQEYLFAHFKDKHFNYYLHGVDEFEVGRKLYRESFNSPAQIIRAYKTGLKFLNNTTGQTKKWRTALLKKPSTKLLGQAFSDFRKSFDFVNFHYSISPWWALEAWQHDFEEIVGLLIQKNNLSSQYEIIMNSLLKPWKQTAIKNVGDELAKKISLKLLVKKYQFLRSWTIIWHKPIDASWIKSTAQAPTKTQHLSQKQLVKLLKPNANQLAFIKLAPYISFFKDWRDDLRRRHAFDWQFLFEAIADYFKIEYNDLGYYSLDEITTALQKNFLNPKILFQRKNREFILTVSPNKLQLKVLPGLPKKYRQAIVQAEKINQTAEIKGIVAQLGVVTGRVRLVRNHHEIKKIEEGEILVTNTTHPDYLQGMKKAAGFVTDEGGIVSHAAIVAREFKKPCIVGTKIATKILKDGDLVEVDANKGIVKLLKKG